MDISDGASSLGVYESQNQLVPDGDVNVSGGPPDNPPDTSLQGLDDVLDQIMEEAKSDDEKMEDIQESIKQEEMEDIRESIEQEVDDLMYESTSDGTIDHEDGPMDGPPNYVLPASFSMYTLKNDGGGE